MYIGYDPQGQKPSTIQGEDSKMPEDLKRHSQNFSPSFAEEYISNVWDKRLKLRGNFWHQITRYERDRSMNAHRLTVPYEEGEEVFVAMMMQLYYQELILIGNNSFSPLGTVYSELRNTNTIIKDEESYRDSHPLIDVWATILTFMLAPQDLHPNNQQIQVSDWTMESALLCWDADSGQTKLLIKINSFWAIELSLPYRDRYGYRIIDISLIFIPNEETKRWNDIKNECLDTIIGAEQEALAEEQIVDLIEDLSSGMYGNEWGGFKYLRTSANSNYPIQIKTIPVYGEGESHRVSAYSIIDIIQLRGVNKLRTLNYSRSGFQ